MYVMFIEIRAHKTWRSGCGVSNEIVRRQFFP